MAFSDWRVQDLETPVLAASLVKPDVVIYAGDDIERFGPMENEGPNIFAEIAEYSKYGVFAVIGNDDLLVAKNETGSVAEPPLRSSPKEVLQAERVHDLHAKPRKIGNVGFIGLEGGTTEIDLPIGYCISPATIKTHLKDQLASLRGISKVILLSHNPPLGVLDEAISFGHRSIGSKVLRDFILRNKKIRLNVCGHVHSHGGMTQELGQCQVVNVASHDNPGASGNIGLITLEDDMIEVEWYTDELNSLPQVGFNRLRQLRELGIKTLNDLERTSDEMLMRLPGTGRWQIRQMRIATRVQKEGRIIITEPLTLPPKHFYCDIETDLSQSVIWIIGIYNPAKREFRQFAIERPNAERRNLADLVSYLEHNGSPAMISYSGCKFEERTLRNRFAALGMPSMGESIKDVDLGIWVQTRVFGKFKGHRLKELGAALGFEFKHPDMNGFDVGMMFTSYAKKPERLPMRKILEYNRDDVMAIPFIVQRINEIYHGDNSRG
jgi:Icc-related predicted phosphoesterase/uncharacterized protein YprB with RNaseH-like and TPR domain